MRLRVAVGVLALELNTVFSPAFATTVVDTVTRTVTVGEPVNEQAGIFALAAESTKPLGVLSFSITWTLSEIPGTGIQTQSCSVDLVQGLSSFAITGAGACSYDTGFCNGAVNYSVTAVVSTSTPEPTLTVTNISGERTCQGFGWTFTKRASAQDSFSFDLTKGTVGASKSGYSVGVNGATRYNTGFKGTFTAGQATLTYPVVLVHGLDGSASTWDSYRAWETEGIRYGGVVSAIDRVSSLAPGSAAGKNLPTGASQQGCPTDRDFTGIFDVRFYYRCDPSAKYFVVQFSNNSDLSFSAQALELRAIVGSITKLTTHSKVFLVGHSMGGLASRAYAQYFDDGKIAGIVTLGTPHFGANWLSGLVTALGIGVRDQLAPGSWDLNTLNRSTVPSSIRTYAIAAKTEWGDDDDVVQVSSQRNNYLWDGSTQVLSPWKFVLHVEETTYPELRNSIKAKLLEWSK